MTKCNTNSNILIRQTGSEKMSSLIIFIATIILLIAGVSLYMKLRDTKLQLESCRSSCSMA